MNYKENKIEEIPTYNCFECTGYKHDSDCKGTKFTYISNQENLCHWKEVADFDLYKMENKIGPISLSKMANQYIKGTHLEDIIIEDLD